MSSPIPFGEARGPGAARGGEMTEEFETLSRRERQIMDIVYARGEASAQDVLGDLPDPPSKTAVRTLLRILEEKGHLTWSRGLAGMLALPPLSLVLPAWSFRVPASVLPAPAPPIRPPVPAARVATRAEARDLAGPVGLSPPAGEAAPGPAPAAAAG